MNFLAAGTQAENWPWTLGLIITGSTPSCRPSFREVRVLAFLAVSALGLLVVPAAAQTNSSADSHLKRGIQRYNARDFKSAIEDFSEAIAINSGFSKRRTAGRSGLNYSEDRELDGSSDRIVVTDAFNAVAYYNRGIAWSAVSDFDHAIADFDNAIRINPRYTDAFLRRGNAWHSKGSIDRAIADYNRAIELDPRSAYAYNNRGIARKDLQDMAGAISDFNETLTLNPDLTQAYINRGATLCAVGDLKRAMDDVNHAIANEPQNSMAYNNRGAIRQAGGEYTGALADYDKAILLDPENVLAYANRGLLRIRQGNVAEGERDLNRALKLCPGLKSTIEHLLRRDNDKEPQPTIPSPDEVELLLQS